MRAAYRAEVAADYAKVREQHAAEEGRALVTLEAARANASAIRSPRRRSRSKLGVQVLADYDLAAAGALPRLGALLPDLGPRRFLSGDPRRPEGRRDGAQVFADGQAMLKRIVEEKWLTANGVFGLFPANAVGDDVEIYTDESRRQVRLTWHNLRQQQVRPEGKPNYCLSDFIAPKDSGVADYVGAFAVTAGLGIEKKLAEFEAQHDDYNAILLKALADRLAEAFAEHLHRACAASSGAMPPTRRCPTRR
jgi:5-methyltetrahydrofolate--homocysteine methyltransferase